MPQSSLYGDRVRGELGQQGGMASPELLGRVRRQPGPLERRIPHPVPEVGRPQHRRPLPPGDEEEPGDVFLGKAHWVAPADHVIPNVHREHLQQERLATVLERPLCGSAAPGRGPSIAAVQKPCTYH